MVLAVFAVGLEAQTIREEIRNNTRCSASNYMAYPGPTQLKLAPAPVGKHPFYISHFGRYGSRYHNSRQDYEKPYRTLAKADSLGKLTTLGKDVLRRLALIHQEADGRYGELTPLGAKQQQQIMIMQVVQDGPIVHDGPVVHDGPKFVLYHIGHDNWFGMGI